MFGFVSLIVATIALVATVTAAFFTIRTAKHTKAGSVNSKMSEQFRTSIVVAFIANTVSAIIIIAGLIVGAGGGSVPSAVMAVICSAVFAWAIPRSQTAESQGGTKGDK